MVVYAIRFNNQLLHRQSTLRKTTAWGESGFPSEFLDNADTNRVNGIVVSAAAKALGNVLADDLLLVFTNRDRDQLHIISPDLSGNRPKLQRLVAYRDQLQRTVPQQIANMWDNYGNKGRTLREAIAEVFSVEPVTRDFFDTYRWLFEKAKEQIKGFGTGEDEDDQKHLFTQNSLQPADVRVLPIPARVGSSSMETPTTSRPSGPITIPRRALGTSTTPACGPCFSLG